MTCVVAIITMMIVIAVTRCSIKMKQRGSDLFNIAYISKIQMHRVPSSPSATKASAYAFNGIRSNEYMGYVMFVALPEYCNLIRPIGRGVAKFTHQRWSKRLCEDNIITISVVVVEYCFPDIQNFIEKFKTFMKLKNNCLFIAWKIFKLL